MDDLQEYVITCVSMEDLESLYNDLETMGGSDAIPERVVPVYRRRPLSQNTHYMLTHEESELLSQDLRVLDIKLYKLIESSRVLNSYTQTGNFSKTPANAAMDPSYRNWALLRCIEGIQRTGWGNSQTWTSAYSYTAATYTSENQNATITVGPTGKNVDVIVMDGICGVPNHPEFAVNPDGTGGSRYIQYNWFLLNSIVTSLDDDAATKLTGAYSYAVDSVVGNANHGANTTGIVAGNTCGWARDANIYQIGTIGQQGIGSLIFWDYIRAFHRNKPINPVTGIKNPTICNCSYGNAIQWPNFVAGAGSTGYITQTERRGVIQGNYTTGTALTQSQLNSAGIYNTNSVAAVPLWIDADAADITQAINDGIIIVASAGNEAQYIDKSTGLDYNNRFIALYNNGVGIYPYYWSYHRACAVSGTPGVICVGATDANATERKAWFSNTGPRVDIFAPGAWIVSSASTLNGDWSGKSSPDSRNSSYYIGRQMGTSQSAPQVTGVLACLLEIYPTMTPAQALSYITSMAKTSQLSDTGGTSPTWTSDVYSLQGGPNKYLFMPQERPSKGSMYPKQNHMLRPTSGVMYPRRRVRIR